MTFFTPEIFNSIKSKKSKASFVPVKNCAFQLGLLVAESLLGRHYEELYSRSQFNEELLQDILAQVKEKTSGNEVLFGAIENLLKVDSKERVSVANLAVALPSYEVIKKEINSIKKRQEVRQITNQAKRENFMSYEQNKSFMNKVIEKSPSRVYESQQGISPVPMRPNYNDLVKDELSSIYGPSPIVHRQVIKTPQ